MGSGCSARHVELGERRAHNIIHNAAQLARLLDVIKPADLHDVFLVFHAARHASRLHLEAGGIGHDGLLEADLRTIGKAGHHGRVLFPFFGEAFLRGGIAVRVLQSFHVADDSRRQSQTFDPAIKVDLQAGLIAIASRKDYAMFFRIDLQNRPDGGIDLGVEQNDVLAVLERFESDARAELDRAGHVHQHIDFLGAGQQEGVFGDHGLAFTDGEIDLILLRRRNHVLHAAVGAQVERPLHLAVVNRHHAHSRHGVDDVVPQALRHEAGADQSHTNGPAFFFPRF